MKYQIERYHAGMRQEWEEALNNAVNGIFLFRRDFMDYHSHRFEDHSLLVREEQRVVALLPANVFNGVLYSHQGLTYGGWIFCKRLSAAQVEQIFVELDAYCRNHAIIEIVYKQKPSVFLPRLCETDAWMLWHLGYELWRRDLNFVIDMHNSPGFSHDKHYRLNKAKRNHLRVDPHGDIRQLMELVAHNLQERFQLLPTHTAEEALLLQTRFPNHIHTIAVFQEDMFLCGAWLFEDNQFVHTQYLHSNEEGKALCAVEFLMDYLIAKFSASKRYLSFGVSTEMDGKVLNEGLASFKEGFGASGVCHDFYRKKIIQIG